MSEVSRTDLPGLNFLAPLEADDFEFKEKVTVVEILQRFQAVFGANFASLNQYGLVSDVNPQTSSSTILSISWTSISDPFTYFVQPGIAVTPKGQLIIVSSTQQVTIPQVNGQAYVIVAKYVLSDTTLRLNKFGDPITARRESTAEIDVVALGDFTLLPTASLQDKVPLGVVTVSTDPVTSSLTTTWDMTTGTYGWNRPWFSPVDYYHRNQKGNVHDTTLEELDQGSIPLMEKFLSDGFIIAQDVQYPFFPGHLCVQEIKRGAVTTSPPFTCILARRPVRLGRLYLKSDSTVEFAYVYDPITNSITFLAEPPSPSPTDNADMLLDTLVVDSFEPALLTTTARFGNVSSKGESAISQGSPIRSMSSFDVPLNNFGPGQVQRARIFIASDGTLIRSPFTLVCQARFNIDLFEGEDNSIAAIMPLPGVPRIIIRDSVDVSGEVVLTGTDVNGAPLQETITFSYDHTLPNGVIPGNFIYTVDDPSLFGKLTYGDVGLTLIPELKRATRLVTLAQCPCRYGSNVFASISSMKLQKIVGGSTSGSVTLQTLLDTRTLLQLAEVVEREGVVESLVDNRKVMAGLSIVDRGIYSALCYADSEINDLDSLKYLENFSEPKWGDFRGTNLEDPMDSTYDGVTNPIRPGNAMFYVSRLLPLHRPTWNSADTINLRLALLSKARESTYLTVQFDFISFASGLPVTVMTSSFSESRTISITQSVSPSTVDAVRVTIRGVGLQGFVLSMPDTSPPG